MNYVKILIVVVCYSRDNTFFFYIEPFKKIAKPPICLVDLFRLFVIWMNSLRVRKSPSIHPKSRFQTKMAEFLFNLQDWYLRPNYASSYERYTLQILWQSVNLELVGDAFFPVNSEN